MRASAVLMSGREPCSRALYYLFSLCADCVSSTESSPVAATEQIIPIYKGKPRQVILRKSFFGVKTPFRGQLTAVAAPVIFWGGQTQVREGLASFPFTNLSRLYSANCGAHGEPV